MIRERLNALSPRDRRALAVVAAAALCFVLLQYVVLPVVDSAGGLRAAIPLKEKTVRKYEQTVAVAGVRETDWRALQDRSAALDRRLLDSPTPALAAAETQSLVKQLMISAGLEMRGADLLPARPLRAGSEIYTAVPVAVSFEAPLDQVAGLLTLARVAPKILVIDQMGLTHTGAAASQRKTVSVRLVVHGLMRPPASPPEPAAKKDMPRRDS